MSYDRAAATKAGKKLKAGKFPVTFHRENSDCRITFAAPEESARCSCGMLHHSFQELVGASGWSRAEHCKEPHMKDPQAHQKRVANLKRKAAD